MKPDGQIPAYEWNFSDVNPPVHAWYAIFSEDTILNVPSQGNVPGIQDRAKVDWERGPCVLGTRLPETPSELYLVLKLSWLVIPAEYSLGGLTGKIKMAKACLRAAFSV